MLIKKQINRLEDFEPWSGGEITYNRIMEEDKEDDFMLLAEEIFPDGCSETEFNDFLWFDRDYIYESLGIEEED